MALHKTNTQSTPILTTTSKMIPLLLAALSLLASNNNHYLVSATPTPAPTSADTEFLTEAATDDAICVGLLAYTQTTLYDNDPLLVDKCFCLPNSFSKTYSVECVLDHCQECHGDLCADRTDIRTYRTEALEEGVAAADAFVEFTERIFYQSADPAVAIDYLSVRINLNGTGAETGSAGDCEMYTTDVHTGTFSVPCDCAFVDCQQDGNYQMEFSCWENPGEAHANAAGLGGDKFQWGSCDATADTPQSEWNPHHPLRGMDKSTFTWGACFTNGTTADRRRLMMSSVDPRQRYQYAMDDMHLPVRGKLVHAEE